jgi:hypothetical protein
VAARRMCYVGHGLLSAPRCAADSFGVERLVLGTDFPYETGAVFKTRSATSRPAGLASGEADCVVSVNAEALFSWRRSVTSLFLGGPQILRQVPSELFRDRRGGRGCRADRPCLRH